MTAQSTNYYGYDKETYYECRELIDETNRKHMDILNAWFFMINLFCTFFALFGLFNSNQGDIKVYVIFGFIAIVFLLFSKYIQRRRPKRIFLNIQILINSAIWMFYSVRISTESPYMAATMFPVLLVVLSFSFIVTMRYMVLFLVIGVGSFLASSYILKPTTIASQDLYNVIIYTALALVLHFAFQRTRMKQFVTFQKNVQIQRELEIKSSFDALTSLLNRGRFFSLAGNILNNPHNDYMAMCLLDLDEFKQINDKLGHQMGDKAIQIAGLTIIETLGIDMTEKWVFQEKVLKDKGSFPGRLGGDEFIMLIRGKKGREEVTALLQQMLNALNAVDVGELHGIQASFGVTEIASDDYDIDIAYKRADEALYESKRAGKNQIRFSKNNA